MLIRYCDIGRGSFAQIKDLKGQKGSEAKYITNVFGWRTASVPVSQEMKGAAEQCFARGTCIFPASFEGLCFLLVVERSLVHQS